MTPEQAKARFAQVLRGELSAREQAQFDAAIESDPALALEFDAFADGHAAGLADVNRWLVRAAGSQPEPDSAVYAHRMVRLLEGAGGRKRGRLVRLAAAIGAVAAAAAIVAVLILPRDTGNGDSTGPTPQEWHTGSSVELMADGQRLYREAVNEFTPADGITLNLSQGALVQPQSDGLRLAGGRVKVRVAEGRKYQVFIGASRIEAKGPAEFDVSTTPLLFDTISHLNPEQDPMFNTRMAARFGATGFLFTVSMLSGNAALHAEGPKQQLAAPQVLQAEAKPDKPHKAPKPEEAFEHLDKNSDGKLDDVEVEKRMLDDFDDDDNGTIDEAEFKKHFKPRPPRGPGPGPGPGEGSGPGRGGEGPGPGREGDRPPRGPEGERPEGPGRGNRPGPR